MANRQIEIIVKEEGIASTSNVLGANVVAQIQMAQNDEARTSNILSQGTSVGFAMAKNLGNQIIGQVGNMTGSSEIQANINNTRQALVWGVNLIKFPKVAIPDLAVQGIMYAFEERQRIRLENHSIELNTLRGGFDRSTHSRSMMYD